ncbi:MAG: hypothetical protein CFE44_01725 [Burkholderiales bacterium PBB4]|nr:MAG: hypothetical protein CFE44_01725 [Burkholderiales bacterium PBB4]
MGKERSAALGAKESLLQWVHHEVAQLPHPCLPLVAALVVAQPELPDWLSAALMAELGQHMDLRTMSPAAEALLKIVLLADSQHLDSAQEEMRAHRLLLHTLSLNEQVDIALDFMTRMAQRIATLAGIARPAAT